jgi:Flp pilus assembly protein TadD
MTSRSSLERIARAALLISAALGLADCASTSGSGTDGAEKTTQAALAEAQVQPAIRLARAARAAGDFASAANLYRSVIAVRGDDPMLTVELGDTLLDAGSFDNAIEAYGKAENHAPAKLGSLLGLTRAHLALREPAKALDCADRAVGIAPSDERALAGRGVALDMLGRHEEAQMSYRAALAASPYSVAARNDLALSLALTGQFSEAVDILTPIAKSTTATPRVRQNLALIYGLMGDSSRAAEVSRADLDAAATDSNLRFFDFVRGGTP